MKIHSVAQLYDNTVRAGHRRLARVFLLAAGVAAFAGTANSAQAQSIFTPGDILVSGSTYAGTASTVTIGQALPGGGTATVNGSYPYVWSNETPDPSFGVTAPAFIYQLSPTGSLVSTIPVPTSVMVTSFSSKSELALNLTPDGTGVTFMGYAAPINQLDASNSNTPGVTDPGNADQGTPTYREVVQMSDTGSFTATTTNAYPGNNGRAAILGSNGLYYTVGNAGNGGSGPSTVLGVTGVQTITPGQNATSSTVGTNNVGGYNITQNGYAADKVAKDNNFRGLTIFDNTLYVTKGSGSNGINTVYQVGTAGTLPTGSSNTLSVLPGFPTGLAKGTDPMHPFGVWFANSTTLYVGDEGDGVAGDIGTPANAAAGLQKWSLVSGTWQLDYTLTNGLNLGAQYSVANGPGGLIYPTSLDPATDGIRNITGEVNSDGTVTLLGITSTVSTSTDEGADPNELVSITDTLADTTPGQATGETFDTLDTAGYGQVLRGVSFTPVPEPGAFAALFGIAVLGLAGIRFRARQTVFRQN